MIRIIVILGMLVGLLLALIVWLKSANYLSNDSPKIDMPNNGQKINENFPRKTFQPNTNWSDKILNFHGKELTYRFGEGNPTEVALLPEQYLPKHGQEGTPYVTAQVEYQLKAFLSDKNLPELLNKCVNYLNDKMASQNPEVPASQIASVLENKEVDIENYLIIDPKSGRKMLNPESDSRMNDFLNTLNNPLDDSPLVIECFGVDRIQDFKRLQKKFHDLGKEYNHT